MWWKILCSILISLYCQIIINKAPQFVIVIPSYNNKDWYRYNLNSVFSQTYEHYRVVYIDDNSTDGTYELVKSYLRIRKPKAEVILIKNTLRKGSLANHYKAIGMCKAHEIIVCLDGDDWFANDRVLKLLSKVYRNKHVWMTYSQFCNWPTGKMGWSKKIPHQVIQENSIRAYGFVTPQLRTYYAWLAQQVKIEDLLVDHESLTFFQAAGDVALMLPMLEMSGFHTRFIPRVLCQRNVATPLNDFKVHVEEQLNTTKTIQSKKPYARLPQAVCLYKDYC